MERQIENKLVLTDELNQTFIIRMKISNDMFGSKNATVKVYYLEECKIPSVKKFFIFETSEDKKVVKDWIYSFDFIKEMKLQEKKLYLMNAASNVIRENDIYKIFKYLGYQKENK